MSHQSLSATATAPTPALLELPDVDLAVRQPADWRVLAAAAIGGLLFDLAARAGVAGLAGAVGITALAVALIATGRVATVQARAVALTAIPFGAFLAVRASDWLVVPDMVVAGTLLTLAALLSDGRSVWDLGFPQLILRGAVAAFHFLAAPAFLFDNEARGRIRPPAPVVRGLALAAPLLLVLGLLLASADAVFASLFSVPSGPTDLVLHAFLVVIGAWGVGGLLRTASAAMPDPESEPRPADVPPKLGRTEANVVLAGMVGLFAAFAMTQVVTALGGARHVLESRGLTYADYARTGFFQLLAVAALTMLTLLALRAATSMTKATLVLAEEAVVLTLVIVAVALYRLSLYEQAYGLTMLRLYCQVFAVWIAVVFVVLGAFLAIRRANGVPAAAMAAGLALLLLLNLANPEAMVVKRNAARAKVDAYYLSTLSDDAVPAIAKAGLTNLIDCAPDGGKDNWAAYNRSRARANSVRNRPGVCQP